MKGVKNPIKSNIEPTLVNNSHFIDDASIVLLEKLKLPSMMLHLIHLIPFHLCRQTVHYKLTNRLECCQMELTSSHKFFCFYWLNKIVHVKGSQDTFHHCFIKFISMISFCYIVSTASGTICTSIWYVSG